jgi:hypothetical protein
LQADPELLLGGSMETFDGVKGFTTDSKDVAGFRPALI